jgi:hypothetical protein
MPAAGAVFALMLRSFQERGIGEEQAELNTLRQIREIRKDFAFLRISVR